MGKISTLNLRGLIITNPQKNKHILHSDLFLNLNIKGIKSSIVIQVTIEAITSLNENKTPLIFLFNVEVPLTVKVA